MQLTPTSSRRPGPTLYRYIAPEALRPAAFALFGLTAVVLTRDFMKLSELVINRGLGTGEVVRLALLEAVPLASQMFPFAVLIGCLVALGRLGADREILALESLGISGSRLVWPILAFAAAMTAVALPVSLHAAPWASRELDVAFDRISRETPWASIRAGVSNQFGGWQLEAQQANARGDELRGVLLWMPRLGQTVFAKGGRLQAAEGGAIEIRLGPGSVVLATAQGPRHVRFEEMHTTLPQSDQPVARKDSDRLEGLSLGELAERAAGFVPSEGEKLPRAALIRQRRFALPVATLVFGFLAAPLFFLRRSFSRAGGGVLGLVATGAYYGLVQLGEGLVSGGRVGAAAAAWLPNAVLLALGVVLFFRARAESVLGLVFERRRRARRWQAEAGDAPGRQPLRIHRWPLPRYVARRFLELALLSFAALLMAYLLIDIMERLAWFAKHQASGAQALRFYAARIPLLAERVIPMSLLVATALIVSLLAADGELIGMRSCGIPAPRAMLPVFLLTALVAPGYVFLNNVVVPRTNELAEQLKRTEIKEQLIQIQASRRRAPVWYRAGPRVIEAEHFDEQSGSAEMLTIYELDEGGLPVSRTDASVGRHIGRGMWRLVDPVRIEVDGGLVEAPPRRFVDLGDELRAEVDTRQLSVAELAGEIREMERERIDATVFRVDFHIRFAEALSCVVLPAVALFFAVSGPPFPGAAQNLLVSGILGVGYILLTSVAASFGYRGTLPPFLGGWAPTLLFGGLAGFFGVRMMRRL